MSGVILILVQIFISGHVLQVDLTARTVGLDWSRYEFGVTVEVVILLIGWLFSVGNAFFDKAPDFDEIRVYDNGLELYDNGSGQAIFAEYKDIHIVIPGKSISRFALYIPKLEVKSEEAWVHYSDGETMRDTLQQYAPQCFIGKKEYKERVKNVA